ncbi:MAG TPA: hypothetical protein DD420_08115, partial [Streptomyces sp.]|nr:hypothetical protein [Streptomyces sp.]
MNKTIAEQAICAQTDPELFFPEKGQHDKTRSAIAICTGCPVRRACLAEALAEEGTAGASHRFGVRGGCSPRQRARMAKERAEREEVARAVAGCGTAKAYYQHLMAGEPIDEACQAASDTFEQQLAVGRPPAACGTRP